MIKRIIHELREHSSFTIGGAAAGIVFMILFRNMSREVSHTMFYVFHPLHVFLSALVTASLYEKYKRSESRTLAGIVKLLIIGYAGSVGIATLSDSFIPYLGEVMLRMPHSHVHVGFIEKWLLVNAMAFAGIACAYFRPSTKFPHGAHVLFSTWASLFHVMMAMDGPAGLLVYVIVFIFLFLSVWLPCCISDIVFPLLFIREN